MNSSKLEVSSVVSERAFNTTISPEGINVTDKMVQRMEGIVFAGVIYLRLEHVLWCNYFKDFLPVLDACVPAELRPAENAERCNFPDIAAPSICTTCGTLLGSVIGGHCASGCYHCRDGSGDISYSIQTFAGYLSTSYAEVEFCFACAARRLSVDNWKQRNHFIRRRHHECAPKLETLVAQFRATTEHLSAQVPDL